jgi:hypothetical protein
MERTVNARRSLVLPGSPGGRRAFSWFSASELKHHRSTPEGPPLAAGLRLSTHRTAAGCSQPPPARPPPSPPGRRAGQWPAASAGHPAKLRRRCACRCGSPHTASVGCTFMKATLRHHSPHAWHVGSRRWLTGALGGGALGGTRTPNLLIRSQMLYPLSYERIVNPAQCTALPSGRAGSCPAED